MRAALLIFGVVVLGGCYDAHPRHEPADAGIDAGCVFRWPCFGTACPDGDLLEGLPVDCGEAERPATGLRRPRRADDRVGSLRSCIRGRAGWQEVDW